MEDNIASLPWPALNATADQVDWEGLRQLEEAALASAAVRDALVDHIEDHWDWWTDDRLESPDTSPFAALAVLAGVGPKLDADAQAELGESLLNLWCLAEEEDEDWLLDALPYVVGRLAPGVLPGLMAMIDGRIAQGQEWHYFVYPLSAVMSCEPDLRQRVAEFCRRMVGVTQRAPAEKRGEGLLFPAWVLADLGDVESLPLLESAEVWRWEQADIAESIAILKGEQSPDSPSSFRHPWIDEPREWLDRCLKHLQRRVVEEVAARDNPSPEADSEEDSDLSSVRVVDPAAFAEPSAWMRDEWTAPIYREDDRIGRNDPCPCGSGKKYKKCCGK